MQLRRAKYLLSIPRWQACRQLFANSRQAFLGLAFVGRRAVNVKLHNGRALKFSLDGRDHKFWDWFLDTRPGKVDFTADNEVQLTTPTHTVLLRPGTTDSFIYHEIFCHDEYGLNQLPQRLGTVVDLGGNVGLFSSAVVRRAQRVITVEPIGPLHKQASKNVARNGGDPRNVLQMAVTGRSGQTISLYLGGSNTGRASIRADMAESTKARSETVSTISLPDLLKTMNVGEVDLLKCDVEGAEYEIFRNTPADVLRRVRRLVMEVHHPEDGSRKEMDELLGHLARSGFRCQLRSTSPNNPNAPDVLKADRPLAA
jgi:FkbM family methyltransferase